MYCEPEDLVALMGERRLLELADDAGDQSLASSDVRAIVVEAIRSAGLEIDSYAAAVAQVPLSPVPPIVAGLCKRIARYNLYQRRSHVSADEIREDYNRCCRTLARIAEGKMPLAATEADPLQASGAGVSVVTTPPTLLNDLERF